MHFSQLRRAIRANWQRSNKIVPYVESAPGIGKSALGRQLARDLGVLPEHYVEFNLSNRVETDIIGVPDVKSDLPYSTWKSAPEFYKIRDIPDDPRPRFLLIEEMSDGQLNMQNPMCRVIYDRAAGELKAHHNCYIYASGNRVEHKSGANKIITKLAGRVMRLQMDFDMGDFVRFWNENGLNPMILSALRHDNRYVLDFDPLRDQNPTPRTWELASYVDPELPDELYVRCIEGFVGSSAAQYLLTFRQMYGSLTPTEDILANPGKYSPPDNPAAQYASIGALAPHATAANIDELMKYVTKFPDDMQVAFVQDALLRCPDIKRSKAIIKFFVDHGNVVFG